jgi:two-component system, NtrC family, sensor kinase
MSSGAARRGRESSVRNRLLQLAVLPFLVLLPALLFLIYQWGIGYYDRLLTFKVTSDLAVAHQYFNRSF